MSYSNAFYEDLKQADSSAEQVIPLVAEKLQPRSVLDVGCGVGAWLAVWQQHAERVHGVDGVWVDTKHLQIPAEAFTTHDLEAAFDLNQTFDLVTSLEVAEHIKPEHAEQFVSSLVRHGKKVLFSAAIPQQGGTHHYNEQWPEYWVEKFAAHNYVPLDPFRHQLWSNDTIRVHYRQNLLLFVSADTISEDPWLQTEAALWERSLISVVHPAQYEHRTDITQKSLKNELSYFLQLLGYTIRKRLP